MKIEYSIERIFHNTPFTCNMILLSPIKYYSKAIKAKPTYPPQGKEKKKTIQKLSEFHPKVHYKLPDAPLSFRKLIKPTKVQERPLTPTNKISNHGPMQCSKRVKPSNTIIFPAKGPTLPLIAILNRLTLSVFQFPYDVLQIS
ncbi:hypothetical protein ES288_A08G286800v1 [Gossypium darwinii]|uniref:Uncharacterized protein n=1 Tax=Gossypium darwinii TaxID=34276 RepID=A0A5D2FU37_GOSDA|nr:hypothetical protein ES288_A08G286800v1 [Gossypium darwinii]